MYIKISFFNLVILLGLFGCHDNSEYSTDPKVIRDGERFFKTYCMSCHNLNTDGIAPRLGDVTKSVDQVWLTNFIRDPSGMMSSGDKRANRLFDQYKIAMPNFNFLNDDQVHAILSYIDFNSNPSGTNSILEDKNAKPVVLPKGDTIKEGNLTLLLEDFATIPSSSNHPPLARIANMRVRPDGITDEFYVNDQRGFIYLVKGGEVAKFFDIRKYVDAFIDSPGIGSGLGSFAFHPDFESNRLVYITHAEEFRGIRGDNDFGDSIKIEMQWVLSEWKMESIANESINWSHRELLRINFPSHSHGFQDMNFIDGIAKDHPQYGLLYLGIGDGGSVEGGNSQLCNNISSPIGSILRIDPLGTNSRNGLYGIPKTNPFFESEEPGVWSEIWAYGFRNPHRLEWISNGKMIVADIGQHSFEELNLITPGANYGWYHREGDHLMDLENIKAAYPGDNYGKQYELPLAQYDHYIGSAICGGYEYTGQIEALKNRYFFGDIVNGKIFYLNLPFERASLNPIYSVELYYKGSISNMTKITGNGRVDLRFGEDKNKELYILSKSDSKIRKVTGVKE